MHNIKTDLIRFECLAFRTERIKVGKNCTVYFGHLAIYQGFSEAYGIIVESMQHWSPKRFISGVSWLPSSYQTTSTDGSAHYILHINYYYIPRICPKCCNKVSTCLIISTRHNADSAKKLRVLSTNYYSWKIQK